MYYDNEYVNHLYILYLTVILIPASSLLIRISRKKKENENKELSYFFMFFLSFTVLLLLTLLIYYIQENLPQIDIIYVYILSSASTLSAIVFMISIAITRFGRYSGSHNPKILKTYYTLGLLMFIYLFFVLKIENNALVLTYPGVHILRVIMAILFIIPMIPNKRNKSNFDVAIDRVNVITLPLIFVDMVFQEQIPLRLYPFIYMLYVILSFKTLKKLERVENKLKINDNRLKEFDLSPREIEVVGKIILGKTNEQIADDLFISITTVKTHVRNIFRKSNNSNRFELVALLTK